MPDKILVVEDDNDIAELICDYFEINGYEIIIENDGLKGYEAALKESFDLIILDIMLPNMDGFEICKKLRETISIPIIMVTAKVSDIDTIRGLGLGADDYIKKPFRPNELVARATANIKRYRSLINEGSYAKPAEIMEINGLSINLNARQVYRDNKEILLANKEFELLEFFIKNPNCVFSRETLFEKIWDENSFGDLTTVTVHIKRLREKIEKDPLTPKFIITVRGAGYRFEKERVMKN